MKRAFVQTRRCGGSNCVIAPRRSRKSVLMPRRKRLRALGLRRLRLHRPPRSKAEKYRQAVPRNPLPRPEPAEGGGGQQAINEAIEGLLEHHAPWLAPPNAVDQGSETVSKERGHACNVKHDRKARIVRKRSSRNVGDEQTYEKAISEPQSEELPHGRRTAGINGQEPHGPLLVFFLHGG